MHVLYTDISACNEGSHYHHPPQRCCVYDKGCPLNAGKQLCMCCTQAFQLVIRTVIIIIPLRGVVCMIRGAH